MRISLDEVDHIATLARLGLTAEERERLRDQLGAILGYVSKLNELDTSHVPPSAQVIPIENVTRPDEIRPGLSVDEVLANAYATEDDYIRVPPVFEEE
ncbi:MAG: Asp-tRNA(Asn)/Glu-tRNA(Gln) amidotransferase subunit GatC [Chloroflexi bacterium]|nr:Asp-tRNA(Asn)/Glu-tRNA(Gln) amidotransferase subunit GatC [Chloroflexota bacterium]